jgi:hypothetical protein
MKGTVVKTEKTKRGGQVVVHFTDSNGKEIKEQLVSCHLLNVAGYDQPPKESKGKERRMVKTELSVYMAYFLDQLSTNESMVMETSLC